MDALAGPEQRVGVLLDTFCKTSAMTRAERAACA
jgi:hypothetical protein